MQWAYGITTVHTRRDNYLETTVKSLKSAGFDDPTLFVDGVGGNFSSLQLQTVRRRRKIGALGNWLLGLLELWIREPHADRYAMFQDDCVTYVGLRDYLEQHTLKSNTYWNLLNFPENEELRPANQEWVWYESNQMGRGAVALVFSNEVILKVLSSHHVLLRPKKKELGDRGIDTCLMSAMQHVRVKELVHYPSLVTHIGDESAIGHTGKYQRERPSSFKGADYDVTPK